MNSKRKSGSWHEEKLGPGFIANHTGLFVSWEKSPLLIHTIQDVLWDQYKTHAKIGPRLANNTAEIILYAQQTAGSSISAAKALLEKYLKMIQETKTNIGFEKKQEVIELDVDEEDSCIVLDDSIDCINTSAEKSTGQISRVCHDQHRKASSLQSNTNNNENRQKREKRRHSSNSEEDVVELWDDDVIILDDSFDSENHGEKSNSLVVDLTRNLSSDDCRGRVVSDPRLITSLTLANAQRLINNAQQEMASKSISKPSTETSARYETSRGQPSKKTSKLSYKRPAHLYAPLTLSANKPTSAVNAQSNIYNPDAGVSEKRTGLRPIVIDGNNVAVCHGKGQFSVRGIELCINYFELRGHRQIKAFVPQYRIKKDTYDQLHKLEKRGTVVITPSRRVDGKTVASYDDRYIVQYATEFGGVIVSSDHFRDLKHENPAWKETIDKRLLMFTWIDDLLMFPRDPLGREGPKLDEYLRFPD